MAATAAADAKDAQKLFEVGEQIEHACEGCHSSYWYPNEKVPPKSRARPGNDRENERRVGTNGNGRPCGGHPKSTCLTTRPEPQGPVSRDELDLTPP